MANKGRKLWARRGSEWEEGTAPEADENASRSALEERLAHYSRPEQADEPGGGQTQEMRVEPAAEAVPHDLADVGEEVNAVLQSAREAAQRIRRAAEEEAARIHEEAEAAVASEIAEKRRQADAERTEAVRLRAEAEAYAEDTRNGAEALAEHVRTEAEREAAQMLESARSRLEAADAEVEQRVRQAEARSRQRLEALRADTKRYEERLESIFVVFRGMSTQLEELLGRQGDDGESAPEVADDDALEDALRPEPAGSETPAASA